MALTDMLRKTLITSGFTIFLMIEFVGGRSIQRKCIDNSYCDTRHEFCDTAIHTEGLCAPCTRYPCHASTIKNEGSRLCQKLCPDYWQTQMAIKVASLVQHTEAMMTTVQPDTDVQDQLSEQEKLLIILAVLIIIAVVATTALVVVCKWDKIKMYRNKVCGLRLSQEEEGVAAIEADNQDNMDPNQVPQEEQPLNNH